MDENEVVPLQCPISIYRSVTDAVVIMQDQTGMIGEDVTIILSTVEAVRAVIKALQAEEHALRTEAE